MLVKMACWQHFCGLAWHVVGQGRNLSRPTPLKTGYKPVLRQMAKALPKNIRGPALPSVGVNMPRRSEAEPRQNLCGALSWAGWKSGRTVKARFFHPSTLHNMCVAHQLRPQAGRCGWTRPPHASRSAHSASSATGDHFPSRWNLCVWTDPFGPAFFTSFLP